MYISLWFLGYRVLLGVIPQETERIRQMMEDLGTVYIYILGQKALDTCCYFAHCSYLEIYISQKIRLCVVDFEGEFQTSLQAETINFLTWKFRSTILSFLIFFARIFKSTAFLHTVTAVPMSWNIGVVIWHKNMTQIDQPFWNSSDSVQKAVDLTIPAKNRRKWV